MTPLQAHTFLAKRDDSHDNERRSNVLQPDSSPVRVAYAILISADIYFPQFIYVSKVTPWIRRAITASFCDQKLIISRAEHCT